VRERSRFGIASSDASLAALADPRCGARCRPSSGLRSKLKAPIFLRSGIYLKIQCQEQLDGRSDMKLRPPLIKGCEGRG
jgi:hypothetical protein